jgi:hypothetical protein
MGRRRVLTRWRGDTVCGLRLPTEVSRIPSRACCGRVCALNGAAGECALVPPRPSILFCVIRVGASANRGWGERAGGVCGSGVGFRRFGHGAGRFDRLARTGLGPAGRIRRGNFLWRGGRLPRFARRGPFPDTLVPARRGESAARHQPIRPRESRLADNLAPGGRSTFHRPDCTTVCCVSVVGFGRYDKCLPPLRKTSLPPPASGPLLTVWLPRRVLAGISGNRRTVVRVGSEWPGRKV